uniref:F-box domain-containing protein n=1 Tax=Caenorhabditis tropicalis TaxID=1561998 RepID=A0A1I7ULH7_9PELO
MNSSISLLDMPDVVMNNIFEKTDVRGMFTLRRVCHSLREYIGSRHLNMSFKAISVMVFQTKIVLTIDSFEVQEIQYRYDKNGCKVEFDYKTKVLDNADFVSVFIQDLRSILSFQKTPLQRLSFSFKNDETDYSVKWNENVQMQIKTLFESLEKPIPVEKFVMNAFKQKHVMSFLPFLDSKFLKEIWILDPTFWGNGYETLYIDKIVKLEQWKGAEKVYIKRPIESNGIDSFKNFKSAYITLSHILVDDIGSLETTFQQSKTLERLRFKYSFLHNDDSELFEILGPSFQTNTTEKNWFIRIPKSNMIMHIVYFPRITNIAFSKIPESEVPEGAVIKE